MIDIQRIRDYYPHPCREVDAPTYLLGTPQIGYCVGGALCLYLGRTLEGITDSHFPMDEHLAELLLACRPSLTYKSALNYARLITHLNDDGEFERAWWMADKALNGL